MRPSFRRVVAATCAFLGAAQAQARVLYVNAEAVGAADCTSWVDACTDLQDAIEIAQAGDEIWIARGVYHPDRGTGDRAILFDLPCGVALYGGFAGTEDCREDRDWLANETILSGDLNNDDGSQNCSEVSNCCVERGSFEYGCDDAECEAIVCADDLECCPENLHNWDSTCAKIAKSACCHLGSWRTCENSYFVVRTGGCGPDTRIDGVTIQGAYYYLDRDGYFGFTESGGLFCDSGSLVVENCDFHSNNGRAILSKDADHIEIKNSSFHDAFPGTASNLFAETVLVQDCQFIDTYSLKLTTDYAEIRSCVFAGIASLNNNGDTLVDDCVFRDGGSGLQFQSGGHHNVQNSTFVGTGEHVRMYYGSVILDNCSFLGSTVDGIGGYGDGLIRNCAIINNAPFRRGIAWTGNLAILNCTIVGNGVNRNEDMYAGGVQFGEGSLQILNSIIWGNGNPNLHGSTVEEHQITVDPQGSLEIDYSVVQGWSGMYGGPGNTGNSGVDPMLADPDGPDDVPGTADDNARLHPASPLINAGLVSPYALPTDLDGHARVLCGAVDIGAYEAGFGDGDCDGVINAWDFAVWAACADGELEGQVCETMDSDADGDIDLKDFAAIQRLGQ